MVLAKLNLLHLLRILYGRVHFSASVYDEVVTQGLQRGYQDAETLELFMQQTQWSAESVLPRNETEQLTLDRGERDTIALALNLEADLVLIDDQAARLAARALGLPVRGTLGVLIDAYHQNLIDAGQLQLYFAEIVRRSDIWINPTLVKRLAQELFSA